MGSIYRYLQGVYESLNVAFSSITTNTVGMVGVKGFSATGDRAENLRGAVTIAAGATSATVSIMLEKDASYYLSLSVRPGTSAPFLLADYRTPTPSGFNIVISGDPTPGFTIVNWVLLR